LADRRMMLPSRDEVIKEPASVQRLADARR
jgi:hypothetical protein